MDGKNFLSAFTSKVTELAETHHSERFLQIIADGVGTMVPDEGGLIKTPIFSVENTTGVVVMHPHSDFFNCYSSTQIWEVAPGKRKLHHLCDNNQSMPMSCTFSSIDAFVEYLAIVNGLREMRWTSLLFKDSDEEGSILGVDRRPTGQITFDVRVGESFPDGTSYRMTISEPRGVFDESESQQDIAEAIVKRLGDIIKAAANVHIRLKKLKKEDVANTFPRHN